MKKTPLLASDEGNEPPSLSSGPVEHGTNNKEESGLMSLVSSSSQQQQHLQEQSLTEPLLSSSVRPDVVPRIEEAMQPDNNDIYVLSESQTSSVYTVVVAGTLALLSVGFVWGSYFSTPWSETHVAFTISWFKKNIISGSSNSSNSDIKNDVTSFLDTVILSSDLGSTIAIFLKAKQYIIFTFLVITSVVLPCLCVLMLPLLIIRRTERGRHIKSLSLLPSRHLFSLLFEYTIRLSLFVIYVLLVLSLATSYIQLEWTDTSIDLHNRLKGGIVSYILGISCAMGVVTVIRYERSRYWVNLVEKASEEAAHDDWGYSQPPEIPPASSFRYAFKNQSGLSCYLSLEDVRLAGAADTPDSSSHAPKSDSGRNRLRHASTITEISSNNGDNTDNTVTFSNLNNSLPEDGFNSSNSDNNTSSCSLSCLYWILCWELCTLSLILLVPMFTLPLLRVTYNGLVTSFMPISSVKLYFLQMSSLFFQLGRESKTDMWILMICVFTTVLYVVIVPIVALALCILIWTSSSETKVQVQYKRWLYCLQPNMNGLTFVIALILTIRSLEPVGKILLDGPFIGTSDVSDDSNNLFDRLSQQIHNVCLLGETCLGISGSVLYGTWAVLIQSVSLELFVILTLSAFP